MRNRTLMLGATAALAIAAACSDSNDSSGASDVALIVNTIFADYDTSSTGSEASEMEHTLRSFGVQVHPVTAYDSASLDSVLALTRVFISSEARGAMPESLSTGALAALRYWVDSTGGVLIVVPESNNLALLDSLFGYALLGAAEPVVSPLNTTEAAGTPFAGGPAQIFDNNGSYGTDATSLPAGALEIYGVGTDIMVALIPQGRGAVVLIGWDWFDAAPHGAQDGGWVEVLRRSLKI